MGQLRKGTRVKIYENFKDVNAGTISLCTPVGPIKLLKEKERLGQYEKLVLTNLEFDVSYQPDFSRPTKNTSDFNFYRRKALRENRGNEKAVHSQIIGEVDDLKNFPTKVDPQTMVYVDLYARGQSFGQSDLPETVLSVCLEYDFKLNGWKYLFLKEIKGKECLTEKPEEPKNNNKNNAIEVMPSEEIIEPSAFWEGSKQELIVDVYERDPAVRKKCIEHYWFNCQVCNFNFESFYGKQGATFIHVHHIKPLFEIGIKHEVDPIRDLRPVCPNCHAMIHKDTQIRTIDEVKNFIENTKLGKM